MAKKKKKKKQPIIPTKEVRFQQAKKWLPTYKGNRLIRDYRKKFRVGVTCAARELHELGYIDTQQMEQVLKSEEGRVAKMRQRRAKKAQEEDPLFGYQDDNFAYIAGYTSGGAPYGLRWDELDDEDLESFGYEKEAIDDDLPF